MTDHQFDFPVIATPPPRAQSEIPWDDLMVAISRGDNEVARLKALLQEAERSVEELVDEGVRRKPLPVALYFRVAESSSA